MLLSLLLSIVSSPSYTHEQLGRSFLRPLFQPALENNAAYFLYPEWQTASQPNFHPRISLIFTPSPIPTPFLCFSYSVSFSLVFSANSVHGDTIYWTIYWKLKLRFFASPPIVRKRGMQKEYLRLLSLSGSLLIIVIVREILSFLEFLGSLFTYFWKYFKYLDILSNYN